MPRKSRDFYLSDFYHLMVQGDEKKYIFEKGYYKDKYIYLLKRNAFRNDIKLIAYCIMDNHAHILVHSKEINRISKMMLQCNTSYGLYYSKERKNVGHVFRDRYRSEVIYTKNHLLNCIKYIHQNPVKAKIENSCEKYNYSSFNEYLNKINPLYEEVKDICDIEEKEFKDIIENSYTDLEYIDIEKEERIKLFFDSLKKEYNMDDLTDRQIIEIYLKLNEKYKISQAKVAKLLNLKRTTLRNKLKSYSAKCPKKGVPT